MGTKFDGQLSQLNVELIRMGALCEEAISDACKALLEGNAPLADNAKELEREIDQKERNIESLCMRLLLQQQPVARDLRTISSALKMISDMERIGDQAADIAEITRHTSGASLPGQIHISEMTRAAVKMVTDSVDSFVKKDLHMAQGVIQYDDVVDQYFCAVKDELTEMIRQSGGSAEQAVDLLMVAKYLERIGDHAVNIAEWVIYSITGTRKIEN